MKKKLFSIISVLTLMLAWYLPAGSVVSSNFQLREGTVIINNSPENEAKMRNESLLTPFDISLNGDTNVRYTLNDPSGDIEITIQPEGGVESTSSDYVTLSDGWNKIWLSGFDTTKTNNIGVSLTSDGGINEQYTFATKVVPIVNVSYSTFVSESQLNPGKLIPWFKFDVSSTEWNLIQLNRRQSPDSLFATEQQLLNSGNESGVTMYSGDEGTAASPSDFQTYNPQEEYDIDFEIFYGEKTASPTKNIKPLDYDIYTVKGKYKAGGLEVKEPEETTFDIQELTSNSAKVEYQINKPVTGDTGPYVDAEIKKLELIDKNTNNVLWSESNPQDKGIIELNNLNEGTEYNLELKGYYDELPFMEDKETWTIVTNEASFSTDLTFSTYLNTDQTLPIVNPSIDPSLPTEGNKIWPYIVGGIIILLIIISITTATVLLVKKRK